WLFSCYFFFFFQAEDGIRDFHVTGVQTCALPICSGTHRSIDWLRTALYCPPGPQVGVPTRLRATLHALQAGFPGRSSVRTHVARSEERRVGKESRARWTPSQ